MKVTVQAATPNPIDVCSRAAGTCYGKDDVSFKRLQSCFKRGHMSVFEHASITFLIEGISRACSHQLVRHRLASYCQESQRYNRYELEGTDWYVMPPSFKEAFFDCSAFESIPLEDIFENQMMDASLAYGDALRAGIPPEDARYLLPPATKTCVTMTVNLREFFHFLYLRTSDSAQWEIRLLATSMFEAASGIDEQYAQIMDMWDWETNNEEVC